MAKMAKVAKSAVPVTALFHAPSSVSRSGRKREEKGVRNLFQPVRGPGVDGRKRFLTPFSFLGPLNSGYTNNFAWGEFSLGAGVSVNILDGNGVSGAALYVGLFELDGGMAQLSNIFSDYNIYYNPQLAGNAYLNDQTFSLNGEGFLMPTSSVMLGDTNGDKVVDAADYIAIKTNFGLSGGKEITRLMGDLIDNNVVDWADLQELMANFGTRSVGGAPAAPEPGSVMLLMFGAAALLRRRAIVGRTSR
jgi:hypothetical protein